MADTCMGITNKNTYGFYLFLIIIFVFFAIILVGNCVSITKLKEDAQEKNKGWYKFLLLFNVIAAIIVFVGLIWASIMFYGINKHPKFQKAQEYLGKEVETSNEKPTNVASAHDESGQW
jgi:hypothetical protein